MDLDCAFAPVFFHRNQMSGAIRKAVRSVAQQVAGEELWVDHLGGHAIERQHFDRQTLCVGVGE